MIAQDVAAGTSCSRDHARALGKRRDQVPALLAD